MPKKRQPRLTRRDYPTTGRCPGNDFLVLFQGRLQLPTRGDINSHREGRNAQGMELARLHALVLLLISRQNRDRSSGLS